MSKEEVQQLLGNYAKKLPAKLERICEEFNVTPGEVLSQGMNLYRRYMRLLQGPLGEFLEHDLYKAQDYSIMKSVEGRRAGANLTPEQRVLRAKAGKNAQQRTLAARKQAQRPEPE